MPIASVCTVGTTEPIEGLQDANGDPLDNPFTGTAQGLLTFAAPDGEYDLIVEASARTFTLRLQFSDVTTAGQIITTGGPTVQTALSGLDSGHLDYETPLDGDVSGFDLAHYAGQGGTSPVAGTIHDYTDAPRTYQLDKVGGTATDYVLGLRRANNAIRRPDKPAEYVGGAGFLRCSYDLFTSGVKSEVLAFYVGPAGNLGWSADPAIMVTGYTGGLYAFQFKATGSAQFLATYESASGPVLNIQDAVGATRTDLICPVGQTSGLRLEALGGGIDLAPLAGRAVTIRNALKLPLYTVATLPSVGSFLPDSIVKVSNGDNGQPCLAVAEGGVWRRIALGAAVSAT